MRELRQADFDPKEKFWTRFPPPSHQSVEFRWKDYCPMVFRYGWIFMLVFILNNYHECGMELELCCSIQCFW